MFVDIIMAHFQISYNKKIQINKEHVSVFKKSIFQKTSLISPSQKDLAIGLNSQNVLEVKAMAIIILGFRNSMSIDYIDAQ